MKKSRPAPMKSSGRFLGLISPSVSPEAVEPAIPVSLPGLEVFAEADVLSGVAVQNIANLDACRLVVLSDPRSPHADRIRYLRMHLREFAKVSPLRTLAVTSANPKDGKSTISLNLATSLAEHGKRKVLLVEADLHQPSLAQTLKIDPRAGLSECLEHGTDPFSLLFRLEPLEIFLLQAGTPRDHSPSDLIQSEAFARVLDKLRDHFDWILFDTPPVEALADAVAVSQLTDGVIFVVRADETPRRAVARSIEKIGSQRIVAIAFNAAEGLGNLYSKYGRYYGDRR